MNSEWRTGCLGEFVELKRGYDLPQNKRRRGDVPLVSSLGVTDSHDEAMVRGPGVVTGRYGTIGQVFFVEQDFWPLNTTLYVRDFKGNDPRFIAYFLRKLDYSAYSDKAAVPGVNRNHLHEASVSLPDPRLQPAIAACLGALDDRIALLRKTNATLEAIAQALFKSWFIDFDPVRAKSQGLAPSGMDEATVALFPDGFEESSLGALPTGWQSATLAEAFELNPQRKLPKAAEAKYLEMASVPTAGHCADLTAVRAFGSGTKFRNGDTLLARITPCLENGKTAFVDFLVGDEIGWGSTEFIVLRPRAPLPEYLGYLLCRYAPFRDFAERSMSGTSGRQRVQNDVLATYRLAIPPLAVAEAFGAVVNPLQQAMTSNHRQATTLSDLRDTLLPRLISGQLRLPQAEEAIAEATHAD